MSRWLAGLDWAPIGLKWFLPLLRKAFALLVSDF
jgi:hypothetical protein